MAVFAGRVQTAVVWKLDRISRCRRDGVDLLADWSYRASSISQSSPGCPRAMAGADLGDDEIRGDR
jgi:hypothetical protein